MSDDLETQAFTTRELWAWLDTHHQTHPGLWVELARSGSARPSVTFQDLLEAGLAFGWSESTRRTNSASSYLQKFTPRRARGTTSERNLAIARRLDAEGRLSDAGRRPLSWDTPTP